MDKFREPLQTGDDVKVRAHAVPIIVRGRTGTVQNVDENHQVYVHIEGEGVIPFMRNELTLLSRNNQEI